MQLLLAFDSGAKKVAGRTTTTKKTSSPQFQHNARQICTAVQNAQ